MKKIGVAILGLGVVGGGAYRILTEHHGYFETTQHVDIDVVRVLETNSVRVEELGIPKELVASNMAEIAADPDINVVVECIGGTTVAREYALAALYAGKTVVSSNKELLAKYWHELERAAKQHNSGLYFEASCVGGVPIVRTLLDGVQSNKVTSMMGIINGTTNYILTKMTDEGAGYEEVLREAQRLGYAESDPDADVEGFDAAYKLSILASLAFHTKVPYTKVIREGITNVSADDIARGKALGYRLKLLAIARQSEAGVEVRVHPAFVKKDHPLASVSGTYNAVFLTGDSVGEVMLYGKGAGDLPTGSAVVSDILFAATHGEHKYSTFKNNAGADKEVKFVTDFRSAYYLRLTVTDKTGVLSKIAAVFGKKNISILELMQTPEEGNATLVIVTHETHEAAIKSAVQKLNASEIAKVETVLRVVS